MKYDHKKYLLILRQKTPDLSSQFVNEFFIVLLEELTILQQYYNYFSITAYYLQSALQ